MINKEKVHDILNSYNIGEYIDKDDFDNMIEVLNNHPEKEKKIGPGINKIGIEKNDFNHRQFFLLRNDGTKEHFSYVKCYCPKKMFSEFSSAMRRVIRDQIVDFKIKNFKKGMLCPISQTQLLMADDIHVDHENPTFEQIVRSFIKENNINVENIVYEKVVTGGRECADIDLNKKFYDFHKKEAKLRILSVKANLTRKKGPRIK